MKGAVKRMLGTGALLIPAVLGIGSTWAYFSYLRETRNRFSVGWSEITITENYDPPEEITPGEEVRFMKKVQIQNTGPVPCYVRVRLEYSDSEMEQFCTHILNGEKAPAEEWKQRVEEFTDGAWTCETDGYYYYRDALDPGDRTALLLEQVEVMVPEEQGEELEEFEILVYGEAVQTMVHESGPGGEQWAREAADYREAWEQMKLPGRGGGL